MIARSNKDQREAIIFNWKRLGKELLPPVAIHVYRSLRYKDAYRLALAQERLLATTQFSLRARPLTELFPGIGAVQVNIPASEICRPPDMVMPLAEVISLAAICLHTRPRRIFEFGTYTGSSTLAMAAHTPPETELMTLDFDKSELIGSAFRGTDCENKIRQLFGDSRAYDYSPYEKQMNLVLVDANHSYDLVKADTEEAFKLLQPGGVIVWDDYRWVQGHEECVGVTLFLNELSGRCPIFQIFGTRLAIYVDGLPG